MLFAKLCSYLVVILVAQRGQVVRANVPNLPQVLGLRRVATLDPLNLQLTVLLDAVDLLENQSIFIILYKKTPQIPLLTCCV